MSVLDTPRVYFRGQITWDPIVTNNFDQLYDLATGKPKLGDGGVAEYRELVRQTVVQGNWNPHGTHRSSFFETAVSGVDRGHGLDLEDAVVGVPMSFTGMLVDLDPYGATSSQLFFDELRCGIDGGCQIVAPHSGPMVARRINFARNTTYRVIAGVASVVWQTSFATDGGLAIHPRGSKALSALAEALDGDDGDVQGLTVRINAYRTAYYGVQRPTAQQAQDLAAWIAAGGFHPNPARAVIVGVIGLWRRGEPPSVPADRVLAQAPGSPVGTAFAKVERRRLAIDLANGVPETGFDLAKLDLGPLSVVSVTPEGDVPLGTLPYASYDKAAYEATSGIAGLPLERTQVTAARHGALEVRVSDGTPVLQEQVLTVCADEANVYLEEGESTVVTLRAFERGAKPSAPVTVTLVQSGGPMLPPHVKTDAKGVASVPIAAVTTGAWTWILSPWRGAGPSAAHAARPGAQRVLHAAGDAGRRRHRGPRPDLAERVREGPARLGGACPGHGQLAAPRRRGAVQGPRAADPQPHEPGPLRRLPLHARHQGPEPGAAHPAPRLVRRRYGPSGARRRSHPRARSRGSRRAGSLWPRLLTHRFGARRGLSWSCPWRLGSKRI